MRMILAAGAAIYLLWAPAYATESNPRGAALVANRVIFASRACANYRVNIPYLKELLAVYRIKVEELDKKYGEEMDKAAAEYKSTVRSADAKQVYCDYMWDTFGEGGKLSGLLKRKN